MTQKFVAAKISGCKIKQAVKQAQHCLRAIHNWKTRLC